MGTGAFIYATRYTQYGMSAAGLFGPGTFISSVIIKLVVEIRYRCKEGKWFKEGNKSVFIDWKKGRLKFLPFVALFVQVFTNNGYFLTMTFAWEFAELGGMNQGVISTLVSFASVFNSIIFYCLYKEKISKAQLVGIVFLLGCALCLALEASSKKDTVAEVDEEVGGVEVKDSNGLSQKVNAFFAIMFGFLAPVLMSTKHVFIRKFKNQLGYKGFNQAIDSNIVEFALFSLLLIPLSYRFEFTLKDLVIGGIAGTLASLGRVFIAIGVADGIAGPAQAMMSTHAIWQTTWTTLIALQALTFFQVLGLSLGILGVTTLSLIDELIKARDKKKKALKV